MNYTKFIYILFLTCLYGNICAQKSIEIINSPNCDIDKTSAKITKVLVIADTLTIIQIDILSHEYKESYIPKINLKSKLITGKDTLELNNIVTLKQGSTNPTDDELQGMHYWKDFKENGIYSCLAIFNGGIPKGINRISLISTKGNDWYSFKNIELNNPLSEIPSSYFIAHTKKKTKLKQTAIKYSSTIDKIKKECVLLIDSIGERNNFFKVIDVSSGIIGYASKDNIELGEKIYGPYNNHFQLLRCNNFNDLPKVEIYNNTDVFLTLLLNGNEYVIKPKSKKLTQLNKENSNIYIVSAPGIYPFWGKQVFRNGEEYFWEFRTNSHEF